MLIHLKEERYHHFKISSDLRHGYKINVLKAFYTEIVKCVVKTNT